MGTKNDPGTYDCYENAEDDEPMFILLARDPLAPALVRHWAELRRALDMGRNLQKKFAEANECATAMEVWASDHPDHGPLAR